jgi:hypothetical protein
MAEKYRPGKKCVSDSPAGEGISHKKAQKAQKGINFLRLLCFFVAILFLFPPQCVSSQIFRIEFGRRSERTQKV